MLIRKTYRYRLEPKEVDLEKFENISGACRFVYNWMLAQREAHYQATKDIPASDKDISIVPTKFNQDKQLAHLKKQYPWLKEAHSQSLQKSVENLDKAYQAFFKGDAHRPTFRRKLDHKGFRYPVPLKIDGNRVNIPKVGWVKFRKSREIQGQIKQTSIAWDGRHWFVCFSCLIEKDDATHQSNSAIGIDLGVVKLVATSDGKTYAPARAFKKWKKRLARAQHIKARRKKGSNNWEKAKQKISKIHAKITAVRSDNLHKVSTILSKSHACMYIEDLKLSNMTKRAHGKGVKAKSGLNRALLDAGLGNFVQMLQYKSHEQGGFVFKVDPKHTSQKCSSCGHTSKANRKTQAYFECENCGYSKNADINAAINILAVGQTVSACGDTRLVA